MKKTSKQFCQDMLKLNINRSKALTNLAMSLSSYQKADSLVELSLSSLFHYQFSSIYKPIHSLAEDAESYEQAVQLILNLCLKYAKPQKRVRLQTDVTSLIKEHSPSLESIGV